MSKYKKSLGIMVVIFSIIILSSSLLLAVEMSIEPFYGLIAAIVVIVSLVLLIPEKWMLNGSIQEVRK